MVDIIFLTIGRTEWACRKCPPPHLGCWSTVDEATHRGIRNANFCSFHHTFD